MLVKFSKLHGLGNDYVYVVTHEQPIHDPPALARAISDRHRGVGGDGLILVAPPEARDAHVRMIMYNADGSRGGMCGNGVRCVAKLAYERGLAPHNPMRVQTDRGVLALVLMLDAAGRVERVRVDMDEPILDPRRIPIDVAGARVVQHLPAWDDLRVPFTAVSMGNPHAVFFVPDVGRVDLMHWGPRVERDPIFPQRVNVHFASVMSRTQVRMVTWERGTGRTEACGTGACAVVVAGVLCKLLDRVVAVDLPGGRLDIAWDEASNHVFMTGPATHVFDGDWPA